jgi:hypothetical protein
MKRAQESQLERDTKKYFENLSEEAALEERALEKALTRMPALTDVDAEE